MQWLAPFVGMAAGAVVIIVMIIIKEKRGKNDY